MPINKHPYPQFGVPLDSQSLNPQLPFSVQYGVTPDNKYIPLCIDESGKLQIGGVSFSGSLSISDVTIKGVDPDNSNVPQDLAVISLSSNIYGLRTSLFDGVNKLSINSDGSINISSSSVIPVQIEHNLDSVSIYGTDGTTDRFLKTDSGGILQVGIVGNINSSFSANVSAINIENTETVLLPINANRKGFSIYNISGDLYIKLGTGLNSMCFSYVLSSRGTLELDSYCGIVTVLRNIGSGMVLVTERI